MDQNSIISDNNHKVPVALSIAGSDSSAGAGIQADIKSAAAMGGYMATVITALTAQNGVGVSLIEAVSPQMVKAQIDAVVSDMNVVALKSGMLPNSATVEVLLDAIDRYKLINIVVDPVMVSTSGATLIEHDAVDMIVGELFKRALIVTPNSIECSYITGCDIKKYGDFDLAAQKFQDLGAKYLLLKGGHVANERIVDVLYDFERCESYNFEFNTINSKNTHGTGCSLSSAIATSLSLGRTVRESVEMSENFVHAAIEAGKDAIYSDGHGAINHFYGL